MLLLSGCAARSASLGEPPEGPVEARAPPMRIFIRGVVWTGRGRTAEAFAVRGGRFLRVGTSAQIAALAGPGAETVDLNHAFVVPGFIDNHVHLLSGGFNLASINLRAAASPEAFTQRLAAFAARAPKGRWILGGDWDQEAWGGALPTRQWIDAVTPDNPVFVNQLDGHMALANRVALRLAGISKETPDPEGGKIVRDAAGEPTGVLKDTAMDIVHEVQPAWSADELDEALARASDHAVANGVTQVHDMGSLGGWRDLAAFRRARDRGTLKVRIYAFMPLESWGRLARYVRENGRGDDWVRWGGLMGFVDGSLGSTAGWFYEPYDIDPTTPAPDQAVADGTRLRTWIQSAARAGLHLAVHAIGDRAHDWLLDVLRETRTHVQADPRFRIEHAQHLKPSALTRFAAQGVIPSMQPYHAIGDGRWAEKRIRPVRITTTHAFRSLFDTRGGLAFGSDWAVGPLNPLQGIYAAVTRRPVDHAHPGGWSPRQKMTIEGALHAYTVANAFAGFQEDNLGSIEAGKLADFVVLSENLLTIEPERIAQVRVLRTVVGGVDRYAATH